MPYQATQLLRSVPEKQSPKISSFENQWGSHSGDPQTYNKLRNGSLKVHMWTHRPQSPKQRHLDFRYMRLLCYSESINLRGRQLIFLIQHKSRSLLAGRRQHLHSLLLPYSSQQAPSFSFSHFYYPHHLFFPFLLFLQVQSICSSSISPARRHNIHTLHLLCSRVPVSSRGSLIQCGALVFKLGALVSVAITQGMPFDDPALKASGASNPGVPQDYNNQRDSLSKLPLPGHNTESRLKHTPFFL